MQQDAVAAGIKFFIIFQRLDKREVILRILWPKRHVTNCRTDLWDGFVAWMGNAKKPAVNSGLIVALLSGMEC
jgi:hypothetical protein